MEYVITFKNTNFAIKAEQLLLALNLQVGVMPLPTEISAGCGICLRIKTHELDPALDALKDIPETGIYSRTSKDGRYSYNQITRRHDA